MDREAEAKTYFAKADYRGKERTFGVKASDRSKHVYVIGKTGMGKSVLLENMAAQDIQNGNGMAFIDPHGEAAETLLDYVPEDRVSDVVYFAPFDMGYPISFNVMEDVGYDKRHLVVSGLISSFKKIWPDVWSPRMEYILSNTLFALLEYPDSTLIDVNRMLINKEFRKDVVSHIKDPIVKAFWTEEFAKYTDRYTQEATPAIQNKIGQFISNPLIRNIIGQPKSSFNFRDIMDNRKVLIMNLSKGRMGDVNARLIGSMLIIKIYLAAMSRADVSAQERAKLPFFYFFVDEFQSFANETFADILSESRKYKLSLTIAHQYIGQMPDEVRDAVFGNVGTMISFRVGAEDAEALEKEFTPTFIAEDMVNLGLYQIYLKLMIDGLASKPFSATTLPPLSRPPVSFRDAVIESSRKIYACPRAEVEELIKKRHEADGAKDGKTAEPEHGEQRGFPPRRREGGDGFASRRFEHPERPERFARGAEQAAYGRRGDGPHLRDGGSSHLSRSPNTSQGQLYSPHPPHSPNTPHRREDAAPWPERPARRDETHRLPERRPVSVPRASGGGGSGGGAPQTPKPATPFKKAFQNMEQTAGGRHTSSLRTSGGHADGNTRGEMSLTMLGKKEQQIGQDSRNAHELKEALKAALARDGARKEREEAARGAVAQTGTGAGIKPGMPPAHAPAPGKEKEHGSGVHSAGDVKALPREIPEDELKKMLGIDEGAKS